MLRPRAQRRLSGKQLSWTLTLATYLLAILLITISVVIFCRKINNPAMVAQTCEMQIVLAIFGAAVIARKSFDFVLGLAVAIAAVTFTSVLNEAILAAAQEFDTLTGMQVNVLSVIFGFWLASWSFYHVHPQLHVVIWAVPLHFLLVGAIQKDQLGVNFNPYEYHNPIQWIPSAVILILIGLWSFRLTHYASPADK
jgi:ribose/xylose/arabinose/galactoside ABC-type transport system permease subunit